MIYSWYAQVLEEHRLTLEAARTRYTLPNNLPLEETTDGRFPVSPFHFVG